VKAFRRTSASQRAARLTAGWRGCGSSSRSSRRSMGRRDADARTVTLVQCFTRVVSHAVFSALRNAATCCCPLKALQVGAAQLHCALESAAPEPLLRVVWCGGQ